LIVAMSFWTNGVDAQTSYSSGYIGNSYFSGTTSYIGNYSYSSGYIGNSYFSGTTSYIGNNSYSSGYLGNRYFGFNTSSFRVW